ncbi:unnamed protein product [Chondrus crispus]|uniref:Transcriptional regulatory protein n=1 Tax=Chondrus crispus TaxID=2769 RepID=R7QSU8_CHOCR|nr:unnamed protein product [Chondrus crispus]CDF40581.1 unnamed protein product [Chondrus crispus]|eukprot:XP_005710875.1 unnamed protein product [Chondrus crispus]
MQGSENVAFLAPTFVQKFSAARVTDRRAAVCPKEGAHGLRMGRRSEKIKGRKDAQNAQRTKVFARIGKMITMAAKAGGPDVIANKALADAIDTAKAASFPKDTMEKAIARATSVDQADFKESSFEAYGHGGTGIYIDVLTDNTNRASADIRTALNKSKLKIASPGSVAFNFDRKGVIQVIAGSVTDADELLLAAIDAGAEECELDDNDDSVYRVITEPANLTPARKALETNGYAVDIAQLEMVPKALVTVSEDDMERNLHGVDMLQSLEDVDGVYMNATTA